MSRNAEIRFVQVKMGLTPGWGGGTRLVQLLGKRQALQLLGKGEKVDLSYGRQLGLVDGELPHGQVRHYVYYNRCSCGGGSICPLGGVLSPEGTPDLK